MPDDDQVQVRIGPSEQPEYLRPQYANHVSVNHTPYDFQLQFALMTMPGPERPAKPGETEVEVNPQTVAKVIVPASVMHGLIGALQQQFDAYLNQFGIPGMGPAPGGEE